MPWRGADVAARPALRARARAVLQRQLLSRSGLLARRVWYPNPYRAPTHAREIDVARDAGLGDVLMATAALRELKHVNPTGRIRFYTNFPALVRGLPYIDEVHPYAERPPQAIFLEYTKSVPSPVHVAQLMGDKLGVRVRDVQPDCVVRADLVAKYRDSWSALPRPHVVVLRRASRFTPNKDWPDASWHALLTELCTPASGCGATAIEIGDGGETTAPGGAYVDLRGATDLEELVAVMAAADLYVGPDSGPLHVAAAVGTSAVVIVGGYDHPVNIHYRGNTELFTPLPCSPCWLRTPCPFGLECLRAITPDAVAAAIRAADGRRAAAR